MAHTSPIEFLKQVRSETKDHMAKPVKAYCKVQSRYFVMVVVASLFLFVADQIISVVIRFIWASVDQTIR